MTLDIRALFIALAGIGLVLPVAAAGEEPTIARVRSTDPLLAVLIERAATQSATFQQLVATIQQSNGMVQIEPGPCGHGVYACLAMWMETAGVQSVPPHLHRPEARRLGRRPDGVDGARAPTCR